MLFVVLAVSTHARIWLIRMYYSCICQARLYANETLVLVQTKMHKCSLCKPNMHACSSCKTWCTRQWNNILCVHACTDVHLYVINLSCTRRLFCVHFQICVKSCSCYMCVQSSLNWAVLYYNCYCYKYTMTLIGSHVNRDSSLRDA